MHGKPFILLRSNSSAVQKHAFAVLHRLLAPGLFKRDDSSSRPMLYGKKDDECVEAQSYLERMMRMSRGSVSVMLSRETIVNRVLQKRRQLKPAHALL